MGFFSSFFEVAEAAVPWSSVEAEAAGQAPTRGGVSDKVSGTAADGLGEGEGEVEVCDTIFYTSGRMAS